MDVILPKPGSYVIAVSGGVDSMALLDLLSRESTLKLTVAHLDHGIREDSHEDLSVVEKVSATLGVPFVCHQVKLGAKTSEAKAREVRYEFLRKTQQETNSLGIITAHHQDDVIETAILNMLRGTGRKGITSLNTKNELVRPLLNVSKKQLLSYAKKRKIVWREDSTNLDDSYLRNYVRNNLIPKLTTKDRNNLLNVIGDLRKTNQELDTLLVKHLQNQNVKDQIDRNSFNQLPHNVAREVLATWFRENEVNSFDRKTLERLVVAAKTGKTGKSYELLSGYSMTVNKDNLALAVPER